MLLISFQKEMQRFDALIYHSLIFKSVTQFWSKFGGSRRHEILKETKRKVYHMIENLSLSIDV